MKNLGRLITAMITPFNEDNSVNYEKAREFALALLDSGSDGVVVVGTTGESPTLTKDEEQKLFAEVKNAVGDRGSVIAGTGSNNTQEAIMATKMAEKSGVDACLLVCPYYNKPTQEGLYRHFKMVAESTSLPCILYNVPSRTVTSISAETTIRLSKIKNIIGTKEASGNFDEISKIIEETDDNFIVWSGNDGDTLPIMALGGNGVVSVASNIVGNQIKEMLDLFEQGKVKEAAAIHRRLVPLYDKLFIISNPVPVKYAVNKIGFKAGAPRPPLFVPEASIAAIIDAELAKHKIDLSF